MKKLIMASITAVVVIVVLAGTLVPVLDDATAQSDTYTNDGYFYMTEYGTDTDITLTWTYENPTVITVNNVDYTISTEDNVNKTVLFCPTSGVRVAYGGTYCQILGAAGTASADLADNEYMTVTCTGGNLTVSMNGSAIGSLATTYTSLYCISETGDYVMKKANESAYVNGDSEFEAFGVTTITGAGAKVLYVNGTVDDGATVTQVTTTGDITYSDPVITSVADNNHEDLYKLDKIAFTATYNDVATNVTYSYFVVPAEVTAERSVHFTDGENAIFNAIPVIVIVALLLGVVAMVLRSRMD